jgi:hypothetical protein
MIFVMRLVIDNGLFPSDKVDAEKQSFSASTGVATSFVTTLYS